MEKFVKIMVVVIVIGGTAYVGYDQLKNWRKQGIDDALRTEQGENKKRTDELEAKVATLNEELEQQNDALEPKEKLVEVFGEDSMAAFSEGKTIDCEKLEQEIISFFNYLDNKGYGKSYEVEEGMYKLFQLTVTQLSEKTPVISDEMKDLTSLMHNMAHFCRTLGKKRVGLFKDIVKNESEILESSMLLFFTWVTSGDRCIKMIRGYPSLEVMYEYAGFFLNTLSGRSYILRRDSKLRALTTYYSVLTLDRANEATLNRHGIDIRPHLDLLFYEISNQRDLIHKKHYLADLARLKEKYQTPTAQSGVK